MEEVAIIKFRTKNLNFGILTKYEEFYMNTELKEKIASKVRMAIIEGCKNKKEQVSEEDNKEEHSHTRKTKKSKLEK